MPNTYVNKVNLADGTILIDISDTTAVASDVASGKEFYLATGEKVTGTSSSGGMLVVETQDSNGGTIMEITSKDTIVLQGQKNITPTSQQQIILPDTGYDGLSSVVVEGSTIPEITVSTSGAIVQELEPDTLYHFTSEALTALTITFGGLATDQYHFDFISPATSVVLTLPQSVIMPSSFSVEVNTKYEIDIYNNYGVAAEWVYEVGA